VICVCDLETTSRNVFDAEIIHGVFFALDDDLNIVSEFELRCDPVKYSEEAYAVHGISREECAKYKMFNEVYIDLLNWIKTNNIADFWSHSNAVMFGKLVYYDWAVLRLNLFNLGTQAYFEIAQIKVYSTHSLCRLFQQEINSQSLSLAAVCASLRIELKHHNARSDALACVAIMKRFLARTTREELNNLDNGVDDEHKRALPVGARNSKKPRRSAKHSFIIQE
jgi:DNA polymerase III epsilon subunit-like protein